ALGDPQRVSQAHAAATLGQRADDFAQAAAVDVFHRVEGIVIVFASIVHLGDVWMVQRGHQLRFVQECACQVFAGNVVGRHDVFQRYQFFEALGVGAARDVKLAHSSSL